MDYRLTQTGAEVQGILDRSPLDVTGAQLDTFITEASEGWYLVPLDSGGSMLVQVVMDGPVIYQVGLTEPHSGRIVLRHYNTQVPNPAWTEWTDAYVDKLTAADIAFGHVSDSGMKITIGGVDHIVSQTSQPLGSSNAFVAPTWEALTIALATKQDTINDLSTIRSGAAAGATAYQKPGGGIPASDMASAVQTDLGKAATAYQKPGGGIPSSDMASAVQTDLGKAASALQPSALNDYYNKTQVDTALGNKQNTLTFDNAPTANSTNPVTSAGIKTYVDNHTSAVDDALSTTSENPVQNKVVTGALNGKQATIDDLSAIRSGAAAGATAIQPDYLQTALSTKQNTLTFDNAPTASSSNPVKSGGVKTALDGKQDVLVSGENIATINGSDITQGGNVSIIAAEGQTITIDATPTESSNNAVSSGGVFDFVPVKKVSPGISPLYTTDLSFIDEIGYSIVDFLDGHIQTKNFKSKDLSKVLGLTNKYKGKKISILGDSISTFGDPDSRNQLGTYCYSYYPTETCRYSASGNVTIDGVTYQSIAFDVENTWWMRVINTLGASLGINESWRGTRVSGTGDSAFNNQTRISHLGGNGTPDLILVFGGTNDAGNDVTLGTFNGGNYSDYDTAQKIAALPVTTFADAYKAMLIRLMYTYPTSEIVCILPTFTTSYYEISDLDNYVEVIKEACDFFGIKWIDVRVSGITIFNKDSYLVDGIHPNATGMSLLADKVYKHLIFD